MVKFEFSNFVTLFFLKMVLALLGPSYFFINFRSSLTISGKKKAEF